MKTNILFLAVVAIAAFSSCYQSEISDQEDSLEAKDVEFMLSFDGVSKTEVTRAVDAPGNLLILDKYNGSVTATTKTSLESVSLPLEFGAHDLYIVAAQKIWESYDKDALTVTWPLGYMKMSDVWAYHLELSVSASTNVQTITLPWVMSEILITSQDYVPANVDHLVIEAPDVCRILDLKTMNGAKRTDAFGGSISLSSYTGKKTGIAIFSFVPSNGEVGDVSLTAYNSSNVELQQRVISDVKVKKGYIIKYSGNIFSTDQSIPLTYEDEWLGDESYSF